MADLTQLTTALAENTQATNDLATLVGTEAAQAAVVLADLAAQIKALKDAQTGISATDADALLASITAATVNLKTVGDAVAKIIPDAPVAPAA